MEFAAAIDKYPYIGMLGEKQEPVTKEQAERIQAVYARGVRVFAISLSQSELQPLRKAQEWINLLKSGLSGQDFCLGCAGIMGMVQLQFARSAGASFVFLPFTDPALIAEGRRLGLTVASGVLTPSELVAARELQADYALLYPADVLSPDCVRAYCALQPGFGLIAKGSREFSAQLSQEYVSAGCRAVCCTV